MRTILVVDDDPTVRALLARLLEKEGFAVATADHGRTALARLEQRDIALLMTDLVMPEAEGIELIIQARRAFPSLPIIAISGEGVPGPEAFLEIARLLGAQRTIAKPFEPAQLVATVRELLRE